ncbi:N-acetyl sugar amidotransferase [Pedobacter sp. MW01-1-1]|uniref:N-acetyl sugar amidotransferase n=1 Tax=Pedobacter sp. MW01-1-1 TaxID=3383027 RepID=UPI003FEE16B9
MLNNKEYKQCNRCVMDTTDPDIKFNDSGICNYCLEAEHHIDKFKFKKQEEADNLSKLKSNILRDKKGKYDCVVGLSGGVDSSYVAYLAKELGLNPLCVHFDNGWNSELAVSNIKKIVDKCGFDLETYVIDWPEFKDLQRSFFKAGVVDIEMLSDHAIMATMFTLRKKHNIKYILSGSNYVTEHGMPLSWLWRKQDLTNIKGIQKKFGTKKMRNFPTMNSVKYQISRLFGLGGVYVELLNNVNYSKEKAMTVLKEEFGWQYYGGKHYESAFTKFYQAYYLPEKFGFDKRKVHLSAQIRNGEISRNDALLELQKPPYNDIELKNDLEYVLKKLSFTASEFDNIMKSEPKAHLDYPSDEWIFNLWRRARKIIRK